MQIPETPHDVSDLDLIKRLESYANGTSTWRNDDQMPGRKTKDACLQLLTNLKSLATTVSPILDRITSKEMDTFTMHDKGHALKVAHLMWHILKEDQRKQLTPPEIGLLVSAAFYMI